jgi:hypothetical protein
MTNQTRKQKQNWRGSPNCQRARKLRGLLSVWLIEMQHEACLPNVSIGAALYFPPAMLSTKAICHLFGFTYSLRQITHHLPIAALVSPHCRPAFSFFAFWAGRLLPRSPLPDQG